MSKLQTLVYKKYNIAVQTLVQYQPLNITATIQNGTEIVDFIEGTTAPAFTATIQNGTETVDFIEGTTAPAFTATIS